jgi:uncharacterized protein (TIGR03382 family)
MLFNLTSNTAATGTLSNGAHVFQLSYVIPAPASAAMLGLAGLAACRRRR